MKFVCSVCGYVYEGEKAPEECPICHAPASKFVAQSGEMNWAAEHVVGVAELEILLCRHTSYSGKYKLAALC